MDIREAIVEANKKGLSIQRKSWKNSNPLKEIIPTNTWYCCIEVTKSSHQELTRWAPSGEDITANDWIV